MRSLFVLLALLCPLFASATPLAIPANASWHLQLNGTLQKPNRQVYDIDLYDTPKQTITNLKAQGRIVICYFSAGTWEDWRSDAKSYSKAAIGKPLPEWPGERWLDYRRSDVRALLAKRLDLARSKGCNGVDPDNVDGYANDNGLKLTKAQQISFNRWLAAEAHKRNLSVGLKNAVDLLPQLAEHFDFAVNESCYQYKECAGYAAMRRQGKPIFIAEYRAYNAKLCTSAKASGFRLQFFNLDLKGTGKPCP
ncbi:endo alpha-1,4 polygalactosaminidase [Pseudomonas sp. Gutcm_11s]|uniref:endo alpha-1,4 polygalactosaminidase n=1 Tax=Pseudomonas sp. Gutcm_11s TaxID=3026088 RepID=UPI00235F308C|nr:endo alpha-1,4 polygalactosaminidase [Pseudomonas sp. Gutcm_11s]MDD0842318.1 endo alpha-1,4 polygalactosaminidase [Pseudomonas sp. Gutcm_11s]